MRDFFNNAKKGENMNKNTCKISTNFFKEIYNLYEDAPIITSIEVKISFTFNWSRYDEETSITDITVDVIKVTEDGKEISFSEEKREQYKKDAIDYIEFMEGGLEEMCEEDIRAWFECFCGED
jgi:hypothetical protein